MTRLDRWAFAVGVTGGLCLYAIYRHPEARAMTAGLWECWGPNVNRKRSNR